MAATASVSIQTLFAPFDDTTAAFLDFITSAKRSVHVVIYGCHLPRFTDLLIAKHQAGQTISIILDHTQAEGKAESGEVARLVAAGVPLLIGTSPIHHQILHSKFAVVDEESVEFGSWNYSLSASQQSNTMSFVRDKGYAADFLRHHDRIRSFIVMHEMTLQPAGATPAAAASVEGSEPNV